ncbi:hypothetical protein BESB_028400 [Besnoitia besnoiti]|uniref:Uncharacterized protein n=1 Tax=Besnoitia besnoiti TaxID=94643 RepID=A0A2A9M0A3_BESBE|nr:uncharacterized protein BESB_028400 [Besnoitia besnoiti]PFH31405.1 hypothetical protein BESB_028400 [Besnoitia besnoiti]
MTHLPPALGGCEGLRPRRGVPVSLLGPPGRVLASARASACEASRAAEGYCRTLPPVCAASSPGGKEAAAQSRPLSLLRPGFACRPRLRGGTAAAADSHVPSLARAAARSERPNSRCSPPAYARSVSFPVSLSPPPANHPPVGGRRASSSHWRGLSNERRVLWQPQPSHGATAPFLFPASRAFLSGSSQRAAAGGSPDAPTPSGNIARRTVLTDGRERLLKPSERHSALRSLCLSPSSPQASSQPALISLQDSSASFSHHAFASRSFSSASLSSALPPDGLPEGCDSPQADHPSETVRSDMAPECICALCQPPGATPPSSSPSRGSLPHWLDFYAGLSSSSASPPLPSSLRELPSSAPPRLLPTSSFSSPDAPRRPDAGIVRAPAPAALLATCEKRACAGCRCRRFWAAAAACVRVHLPHAQHQQNDFYLQELYPSHAQKTSLPTPPLPLAPLHRPTPSAASAAAASPPRWAPPDPLPPGNPPPHVLSPGLPDSGASPFRFPAWSLRQFDLRTAIRLFCLLGSSPPPRPSLRSPSFRTPCVESPPSSSDSCPPLLSPSTSQPFSTRKSGEGALLGSGAARPSGGDSALAGADSCADRENLQREARINHGAVLHVLLTHILLRYQRASTLSSRFASTQRGNAPDAVPSLSVHELRQLVQVYVHLASQVVDCVDGSSASSSAAFLALARQTVYTVFRSSLALFAPSSSSLSSCATPLSASLSPRLSLHSSPILRNPSSGLSLSQLIFLLSSFSSSSSSSSLSPHSSSSSSQRAPGATRADTLSPLPRQPLLLPWASLPPPPDFLFLLQVKLTQQGGANVSVAELVQAALLLAPQVSVQGGGRDSQGLMTFKAIGDELEYRLEELCGSLSSADSPPLSSSPLAPSSSLSFFERISEMEASPDLAVLAVQAFADGDVSHEPFFNRLCDFLLSPCSCTSPSGSQPQSQQSPRLSAARGAPAVAAAQTRREEATEDSEEENEVVWLDTWKTGQVADLLLHFRRLRFSHDELLEYLWHAYDGDTLTPGDALEKRAEDAQEAQKTARLGRRQRTQTTPNRRGDTLSTDAGASASSETQEAKPLLASASSSAPASASSLHAPPNAAQLEDCTSRASDDVGGRPAEKKIRFYHKCTPEQLLTFLHTSGFGEVPPPSPQWQNRVIKLLLVPPSCATASPAPAHLVSALASRLSPTQVGDLAVSLMRLAPLAAAELLSLARRAPTAVGASAPPQRPREPEGENEAPPVECGEAHWRRSEQSSLAARAARARQFLRAMPLGQLPSFCSALLLHSPPLALLSVEKPGRTSGVSREAASRLARVKGRSRPPASSAPASAAWGCSLTDSSSASPPADARGRCLQSSSRVEGAYARRGWLTEIEEVLLLSWSVLLARLLRLWRHTAALGLDPILKYALLHHQLSSLSSSASSESSRSPSSASSAPHRSPSSASSSAPHLSRLASLLLFAPEARLPGPATGGDAPRSAKRAGSDEEGGSAVSGHKAEEETAAPAFALGSSLDSPRLPDPCGDACTSSSSSLSLAPPLCPLPPSGDSASFGVSSAAASASSSFSPLSYPGFAPFSPPSPSLASFASRGAPAAEKILFSPLCRGVPGQLPTRPEPQWADADPALTPQARGLQRLAARDPNGAEPYGADAALRDRAVRGTGEAATALSRGDKARDERGGGLLPHESRAGQRPSRLEEGDVGTAGCWADAQEEADVADVRLATAARLCRQTLLSLLLYAHLRGAEAPPGATARVPRESVARFLSRLPLAQLREVHMLTLLSTSGLLWGDAGRGTYGTKGLYSPVFRAEAESAETRSPLDGNRACSVLALQALLQQTLLVRPEEEAKLREALAREAADRRERPRSPSRQAADDFFEAARGASPRLREEWAKHARERTEERQRKQETRDAKLKEKLTRKNQMRLWGRLQRPRHQRGDASEPDREGNETEVRDQGREEGSSEVRGEGNDKETHTSREQRSPAAIIWHKRRTEEEDACNEEAGRRGANESDDAEKTSGGGETRIEAPEASYAASQGSREVPDDEMCLDIPLRPETEDADGEPRSSDLYRRLALAEEAAKTLFAHRQVPTGDATPHTSNFHRQVFSSLQPALQLVQAQRERSATSDGHEGDSTEDAQRRQTLEGHCDEAAAGDARLREGNWDVDKEVAVGPYVLDILLVRES